MIYRLCLVLLSSAAFAPPASHVANTAVQTSATAATGWMNFLEAGLFQVSQTSNVHGVLPHLFRIYNMGIMAIAIGVLAFSIMFGAAVMAGDGDGFSRKLNIWVYIRSLLGIGMLIPMPNGPFSIIQELVLRVVWWSLWLAGYVFSGVVMNTTLPADDMDSRLLDSGNQSNYTQAVSMAACALSYAPDGVFVDSSGTQRTLKLVFDQVFNQGVYRFMLLPQCSTVNSQDPDFPEKMREIIAALRTVARPIIQAAQTRFDENIRVLTRPQGADPNTFPVIPTDQELQGIGTMNTLCEPFGMPVLTSGSTCSTGTTTSLISTDCWNQSILNGVYSSYAQILRPQQPGPALPSSVQNNPLELMQWVTNFNNIARTLSPDSRQAQITYTRPNIHTGQNPRTPINWLASSTTPPLNNLTAQERTQLQQASPGDQDNVRMQIRMNRAREEISHQVYHQLFSEISGGNLNWFSRANRLTADSISQGGQSIQNRVIEIIRGVRFPRSHQPQWVGTRIHTVQTGIEMMLQEAMYKLTGARCTQPQTSGLLPNTHSNCSVTNGEGLFGYQLQPKSPVDYIRDMGIGMALAGIHYQRDTVSGPQGIMVEDDRINQKVYAASASVLATAVALESVSTIYLVISWARAANIAIYATASVMIESFGYMADLDQYQLYKYQPLGNALSMLLMIWGGLFGVFLPAVPYMIFMFSIMGWILLIIEAMFASPLIALGLTHPNSHQFLGASDQSMMMFLLLAFRPATILIGTFFALFVAKNAVFFLNEGTLRFLEVFFDSVANYANRDKVALLFGVMLVYSYTLFVVLVQSFSIIGMLPDKIGSWIGMGPMGGTNPIQQIMGLRSAFESGAQSTAQGVGGTGGARRGSHSQDGTMGYKHLLRIDKAKERAGAVTSSVLRGAIKRGLQTTGKSKDRWIRRATSGLSGDTRLLAIKALKSDQMSIQDKMKLLDKLNQSKWLGVDTAGVNKLLDDNNVRGYRMKSSGVELLEERHKKITGERRAKNEPFHPDAFKNFNGHRLHQNMMGSFFNGSVSGVIAFGSAYLVRAGVLRVGAMFSSKNGTPPPAGGGAAGDDGDHGAAPPPYNG